MLPSSFRITAKLLIVSSLKVKFACYCYFQALLATITIRQIPDAWSAERVRFILNLPFYFSIAYSHDDRLRDQYAGEFHLFKPDKKLNWLPHLGTLKLDIELDDRTVSAEVPPLEAAFIELFSQKGVLRMLLSVQLFD